MKLKTSAQQVENYPSEETEWKKLFASYMFAEDSDLEYTKKSKH